MAQGDRKKLMTAGTVEFEQLTSWAGTEQVFDALPVELQHRFIKLMEDALPHLGEFRQSLHKHLADRGIEG